MNTIALHGGAPKTMSSREIAELTGKEHRNVMRDIRVMLDALNEDVLKFERMSPDAYGRQQPVFELDREMTELLLTGYSVELRRRVLARWRELEAQAARPTELSRMDILKLAMESEQARIEAEAKLAIAAPKAEFVDRYVQADSGSMGLRQVCKLLAAKQNEFVDFLLRRGFMYRQTPQSSLQPRAEHIHNGRFEAKTGIAEHGEDNSHAYVQYKFTAKGVEWIAGEWAKFKIKTAQVATP